MPPSLQACKWTQIFNLFSKVRFRLWFKWQNPHLWSILVLLQKGLSIPALAPAILLILYLAQHSWLYGKHRKGVFQGWDLSHQKPDPWTSTCTSVFQSAHVLFLFIYNMVKIINFYMPIHQFPLCSISHWGTPSAFTIADRKIGNGELQTKNHLTDFYSNTDWKTSTLSTLRVNSNHLTSGKRKQTCMFRNKCSVDRHRAMATRDSVPEKRKYLALELLCVPVCPSPPSREFSE